ncbi:hypothetical protein DO021_17990 [Desulfobacter hydrogenophilus]|uniref:Uncharacterized protein n=1 Tax=Desulfobacter hydrogenophilus TaxID=2291 RepID=A0A328F7J5_9BACT|nr:hypothetical protein [Desulfobacter hydrogenophilus]NDY73287.1 hypothetical protein [Desulfobacter hydrogenophilus]QBH15270.1 hypothetical protein EYB58_21570 [Desulfobacter hydrogenophilus]RAM00614.1 hypothetical protein DO021_17990 [Desulfobacter hydrogenophilus]
MKIKMSVLIVSVVFLFAMIFAGCGNQDKPKQAPEAETQAVEEIETQAPEAETQAVEEVETQAPEAETQAAEEVETQAAELGNQVVDEVKTQAAEKAAEAKEASAAEKN